MGPAFGAIKARVGEIDRRLSSGGPGRQGNWLHDVMSLDTTPAAGFLSLSSLADLPILAGTDAPQGGLAPGYALHGELAIYVSEGLTSLQALQSATLNPAKMLRGTDSLGTVAAGKLADLVLLDGNPLADITNTTAIRAVVANGRYFDRVALDQLLAEVQAKNKP